MPVLQQKIDTYQNFLKALYQFSTDNGWDLMYGPPNSSNDYQMGLSKGNCHISIGLLYTRSGLEYIKQERDYINGGTVDDGRLTLSLMNTNKYTNPYCYGNPGQLAQDYWSTTYCIVNNLIEPFENVWFFTNEDGDYIHCVFQKDKTHFVPFSFGNVDIGNMTVPASGYAGGNYYLWWNNQSSPTSSSYAPNQPNNNNHDLYLWNTGYKTSTQCYVPPNVLNTKYFKDTNGIIINQLNRNFKPIHQPENIELLNYYEDIRNTRYEGGVPLHQIPLIYKEDDEMCFVGTFPDTRLVNMYGIEPGEEITYANETWVCFPWRKVGLKENVKVKEGVNTIFYGVAYKKII